MLYWLLFAVLAVILVFLVVKILSAGKSKKAAPGAAPAPNVNLTIKDARKGDTISVPAEGDDFEDLDFLVDRRNRYECGNDEWYELSGTYRGRRVYVEWYEDDELEVTLQSDGQEHDLRDLGLVEEQLAQWDEEEDHGASFDFAGESWHYQTSDEIGYFKDGAGAGEGFYCWEFENGAEDKVLAIEKWEGEPFSATVSKVVNPRDIRVFRA